MQIHQPLAQNPAAGEHRNLDIFIHPTQHNYGRPQRPNQKLASILSTMLMYNFPQNAQNPITKNCAQAVHERMIGCKSSQWSESGSSCSAVHPRTTSALLLRGRSWLCWLTTQQFEKKPALNDRHGWRTSCLPAFS